MALTEIDDTLSGRPPEARPVGTPDFLSALARLPEIHAEAAETAQLGRLLRSAADAAGALMLLGAAAVMAAGGGGLKAEFIWVLLMLAGVGALLRCYIKSTAQAFDRTPLRRAARELRGILFYTGLAWGAGAFLLLGNDPLPIMGLCFAVLPSVILVPLLRDKTGSLLFLGPVTALTAAAMALEHWSATPVALAMLLVVQGIVAAGVALAGRTGQTLPAGLSLP